MKHGKFESDQESANEKKNKKEKEKLTTTQSIIMYLHDLSHLLCIVLLIMLLCLRVVIVEGGSMKNTLVDGDYIVLLSNTIYRNPKQGDIIIASKDSFRDGEAIIKRVIAVEGQTVDIDFYNGIVYVDNEPLVEEYTRTLTTRHEGTKFPLTVDKGCVFVLGDNRDRSLDSRSEDIGLIDTREILGKAIFLLIPGNEDGEIERDFTRIGGIS